MGLKGYLYWVCVLSKLHTSCFADLARFAFAQWYILRPCLSTLLSVHVLLQATPLILVWHHIMHQQL